MIDSLDIDLIGNEEEVQEPIEDKEIIEDSKTIIEEPEPTKDDILLKSAPVKATTTTEYNNEAFSADTGVFGVYYNGRITFYTVRVSNIPIGTEYQLRNSRGTYPSATTYYKRGTENLSTNQRSTNYYYWDKEESQYKNTGLYVIIKSEGNNDLTEIQNQLNVMESAIDGIYDNVYDNQMKIDNNNDLLWEVNDYVQGIPDNPVFVSIFGKSDNNNQNGGVGMVSQNIMTTPINQYGLSDSMNLILILMAVSGLIVYLIHKSIFKWGKR